MLTITIQVDAPPGQAIGIKEELAMHLEQWGDARVVEVREVAPEQMQIGGVGRLRGNEGIRQMMWFPTKMAIMNENLQMWF